MAKVETERNSGEHVSRIPRPVPGGTESIESLGGFIDNVLMGHDRTD